MKLHVVQLRTYNFEAMVAFYTKLFGYTPTKDGYGDCGFKDHHVKIVQSGITLQHETKNLMLSFLFDDEDNELIRIKNMGIVVIEPSVQSYPGYKVFHTSDPDENAIILITKLE